MTVSSIMTVPTITLRLSRRRGQKIWEKQRAPPKSLHTDGDGIPLAFSLFPGNLNEQTSLKPLDKKILQEFGCDKFIYCSDAGLALRATVNLTLWGKGHSS